MNKKDFMSLTIFLSTKGKNKDAVPPQLASFLEYVGNPSTKERTEDVFLQSPEAQKDAQKDVQKDEPKENSER